MVGAGKGKFMNCSPKPLEIVNVPGVAGADGISSFTTTTASFTVPAIGSNVTVNVANPSWMVVDMYVLAGGPANFTVVSFDIPSQTAVLKFLGLPGDVAPLITVIPPGSSVSPVGQPGANGVSAFTTTSGFTIPSPGLANAIPVPVAGTAGFIVNEYVICAAAGGSANFQVVSVNSPTSMTLNFLNNTGDAVAGTAVVSGSVISPTGGAGQSSFTTVATQNNVPGAVYGTVTLLVGSTKWMPVNSIVVVGGKSTYSVTTINSPASVTLTWLNYFGDVAANSVIPSGATVSPSGTQPSAGQILYVQGLSQGSPYAITTTATPADTGVSMTLPAAPGKWLVTAYVNIQYSADYNGFAAGTTWNAITTLLQNTGTSTNLAGGTSIVYPTPGNTLGAGSAVVTLGVVVFQAQPYTSAGGDSIAIMAAMSQALQAGNINIVNAVLVAQQIG
jgi:hypothetical protein